MLVLEARGIDMDETQRQRILACHDAQQLERWLRLSPTVSSIDELLREP